MALKFEIIRKPFLSLKNHFESILRNVLQQSRAKKTEVAFHLKSVVR
jgi:hypothetical protein